ncbi:MAG: translesion error-prone DNA polymerase V autoproteolytic subunit [Candidatus Paceibacterota bacterium]
MEKTLKVTAVMTYSADFKIDLPLYSSRPAAGFPMMGDDLVEKTLDLNELLVNNPNSTFFVRIEGDSMEGAGIFSGDILVVDRSLPLVSGKIVIAAVYGEMVVKYLKIKNNQTELVSANKDYKPIIINENDDCFVWGVVTASVRDFR